MKNFILEVMYTDIHIYMSCESILFYREILLIRKFLFQCKKLIKMYAEHNKLNNFFLDWKILLREWNLNFKIFNIIFNFW